MRVWLVILTLGFAGLVGVASPVRAQTDDERARTHFEAARSYYDQARYEDAAREFQQAFDLSGRPEMLLNLSQAHERSLHYADAIGAVRRYLELVPQAADRKTVEDRIQNLEQLKRRYEQGGPAPLPPPAGTGAATVTTDTGAPEDPTAPAAVQPRPPLAEPVAKPTAPDTATPSEPASVELGSEAPNRFTIPAIVLMGTGGAALVASLVTGLVAHADYKSLVRQCTPSGDCPVSAEDELDEGKTLSVMSTVLAVVGVVAAGTGTALLIIGANESSETRAPEPGQLSVAFGFTPVSATARLTF